MQFGYASWRVPAATFWQIIARERIDIASVFALELGRFRASTPIAERTLEVRPPGLAQHLSSECNDVADGQFVSDAGVAAQRAVGDASGGGISGQPASTYFLNQALKHCGAASICLRMTSELDQL